MEWIVNFDMPPQPPCGLALGGFDGLHRGHMAVIQATLEGPDQPVVFTFSAPPSGEAMVLTAADKKKLLAAAGVERVYSAEFSALKTMEAASFVETLLFEKINARRLCCGEDFRFGRGAAGDVGLLRELCQKHGVGLTVLPPVSEDGEKISSSRIRRAVERGDIPTANRLLGRPFGFQLEVIHGNHIGTGLGTPTINQALPENFVRPRFGVYAAWCLVEGHPHFGVCNIGVKPTVGSDRVLAETWMPDFSGDLYGERVRVELVEFLRPERKFDSLEELKAAIQANGEQARALTVGAE